MSPLMGSASGIGLRVLSVCLGTFMFSMGFSKIGWLNDPGLLENLLKEWLAAAPTYTRWYLETVAIPGSNIFARVIPITEMLAGAAMVLGVYPRFAAAIVFCMVLNFHFASDLLVHIEYLTNPYGLPVLGGLLALAFGASRLPLCVRS